MESFWQSSKPTSYVVLAVFILSLLNTTFVSRSSVQQKTSIEDVIYITAIENNAPLETLAGSGVWRGKVNHSVGIQARAWNVWLSHKNISFPCVDPGIKLKFYKNVTNSNAIGTNTTTFVLKEKAFWKKSSWSSSKVRPTQGMLFIKPMKVGGSTAVSAQLRISRNMALRQQKSFPICENSYDHARGVLFEHRHPQNSFLWSLLRDPTHRAISFFYHMFVSKGKAKNSDEHFVNVLSGLKDYYVKIHAIRIPSTANIQPPNITMDELYTLILTDIMSSYNFIGITERMDESLVVMKMLLPKSVPLGDMLYLSTKIHGGYDNLCNHLQPSNLTSNMRSFLESDHWQSNIHWDKILYDAVNASLDATIDMLGRHKVESLLKRFQHALKTVADRCQSHIKMGCTGTGERRPARETNCLFQDSACAYQCIDQVAVDLGLSN